MQNPDEKAVFGVSPTPGGAMVVIGIPAAAWEYMKDGKTHTFDLTKIGLPIKLMLFGAKDRAEAVRIIEQPMQEQGLPVLHDRKTDFSL